jgi:hypothetical protein
MSVGGFSNPASAANGRGTADEPERRQVHVVRRQANTRTGACKYTNLAHTRSMSTEDAAGRQTIGIWYRTVWWALDELVAKLPPEQLRKLHVRAGGHLAAILTTTFLRTAPTEVDTEGGVDLRFDLSKAQEPRPTNTPGASDDGSIRDEVPTGRDPEIRRPHRPGYSCAARILDCVADLRCHQPV